MQPVSIDTLSKNKADIDQSLSFIAQGDFNAAQENFIKKVEGYIDKARNIGDGVMTIGYGFNMGKSGEDKSAQTIAAKKLWDTVFNSKTYDFITYKSGKTPLSEADSLKLLRADLAQRSAAIDAIDGGIYKLANIGAARRIATMSMYYNAPSLLGSDPQAALSSGDDIEVDGATINTDDRSNYIWRTSNQCGSVFGGAHA